MISPKIRRISSIVLGTFCILLMVTFIDVFALKGALAQASPRDCPRVYGTYLVKTYLGNTINRDKFTGRRVITLTPGGQFFTIDSNQGGTYGVPPTAEGFPNNRFTSGEGSWDCSVNDSFVQARTFNFNFPDPSSSTPNKVTVAKADYDAKFNLALRTVSGTFTVTTFPLDGEVPEEESSNSYSFAFVGEFVETPY